MKLNRSLLALALSASVCAAAAAPIELLPTGGGTLGATFVQTVDEGSLVDYFDFTPSSFAGLVAVSLHSLTGPVSLLTASINDVGFGNDTSDLFNFSFQAQVGADMPLNLTVLRAVEDADGNPAGSGSYTVSVNAFAAAVPEPQTWALLIVGLLAIGLTARKTRRGR